MQDILLTYYLSSIVIEWMEASEPHADKTPCYPWETLPDFLKFLTRSVVISETQAISLRKADHP
jgi:hypothetical protein